MEGFSVLAGQLFLILCVQSVLEAMASKWQSGFMQKPIELGWSIALVSKILHRVIFFSDWGKRTAIPLKRNMQL